MNRTNIVAFCLLALIPAVAQPLPLPLVKRVCHGALGVFNGCSAILGGLLFVRGNCNRFITGSFVLGNGITAVEGIVSAGCPVPQKLVETADTNTLLKARIALLANDICCSAYWVWSINTKKEYGWALYSTLQDAYYIRGAYKQLQQQTTPHAKSTPKAARASVGPPA